MATVRVQREDFDAGAEAEALVRGRRDVGAVASWARCRRRGIGRSAPSRRSSRGEECGPGCP